MEIHVAQKTLLVTSFPSSTKQMTIDFRDYIIYNMYEATFKMEFQRVNGSQRPKMPLLIGKHQQIKLNTVSTSDQWRLHGRARVGPGESRNQTGPLEKKSTIRSV